MMNMKKRNLMVKSLGGLMVMATVISPLSASASSTAVIKADAISDKVIEFDLDMEGNDAVYFVEALGEKDAITLNGSGNDILVFDAKDVENLENFELISSGLVSSDDSSLIEIDPTDLEGAEVVEASLILPANSEIYPASSLTEKLKGLFTTILK